MNRQSGSLGGNRRAAMATILREQGVLVTSIGFIMNEMIMLPDGNNDVIEITNHESFTFFRNKVDFMAAEGILSEMVGIPMTAMAELMEISPSGTAKCTPLVKHCIFAKYMREGATQSALHRELGISQSTISRIISSVSREISSVAPRYISFPSTREQVITLRDEFIRNQLEKGYLKAIPCYGIIDGKHWRCNHPPNSGSLNRNYRAYFSFNSIAVCDSRHRIIYLQISTNGVNSDSQMMRAGPLPGLLEHASSLVGYTNLPGSPTPMNTFILGDGGFGLSKNLLTPYQGVNVNPINNFFNMRISGTRVLVENLFGILCSRFHIFRRPLNLDPMNSRALIVSAAVIHNIIRGSITVPQVIVIPPSVPDTYRSPDHQRLALKNYIARYQLF